MDAVSNTFVSEGLPEPAAAPPSSAPEPATTSNTQNSARAPEHHDTEPVEQIRDLDWPQYAENDVRKSLEPEPPADLLRPEPEASPAPIEPPRSWNKDARERFAQLPREAQEYIAAREEERDRVVRQAQNEAARAKQEADARFEQELRPEIERVRQQQELARLPIEVATAVQQRDAAATEFGRRYPDLTNAEFADQYHQRLLAQDPAKAEQFVADIHELAKIASDTELVTFKAQQEAAKQQAEQRQAYTQQLTAYHQQQDEAFAKKHPEFANPEKAREISEKQVMPFLREGLGLSQERIRQLWASEPLFRSVESQSMLYYASKGWQAERAARNAVPAMRKPQSPGVSNGAGGDDLLSRAAERGDMQAYTKLRASGKIR
jgi:hypothetical protein